MMYTVVVVNVTLKLIRIKPIFLLVAVILILKIFIIFLFGLF